MALTTARPDSPMLLTQSLILPPEQFAASWDAKGMCAGSVVGLCGTRLLGCGHTHVLVEDLHLVAGEPDVHGLVRQGVRDGVAMPVDFDVVVEVVTGPSSMWQVRSRSAGEA